MVTAWEGYNFEDSKCVSYFIIFVCIMALIPIWRYLIEYDYYKIFNFYLNIFVQYVGHTGAFKKSKTYCPCR